MGGDPVDLLTEPFGSDVLEWGALPLRLALGVIFPVLPT